MPREAVKVARDRDITILSMHDVMTLGLDKVAEIALDVAWDGCDTLARVAPAALTAAHGEVRLWLFEPARPSVSSSPALAQRLYENKLQHKQQ